MKSIDLLIEARHVLAVDATDSQLDAHAIAVHHGRIHDILPISEARQAYAPARHLQMDEHVLIPGLINSHTHAAMNLFRGLANDLPLMDWLHNHIWPAEGRWMSETFVQDGTRAAIAEMQRGGVTCFNDMYFFPEVAARTCIEAGMRACVGLIVLDFPTLYAANAEEYIHKGLSVHDSYKGEPLVTTAFAPHAPYTVSDEPFTQLHTYADELDLPVHTHLHETAHEVQESRKAHGKRPLARLAGLGLVNPALLGVHMTQLLDAEIDQLAQAGVNVVHCPESNLKLASGFCPTARLLQAGVNVALGTDGASSNDDLDLFAEMRTAALLAKGIARDATAVPAASALRMATINGAAALGLGEETGSLEIGKVADIVAVDLGDIETRPYYDPAAQLVYATGRDKVTDVWIAGQQVLKSRQLTLIDEDTLKSTVSAWNTRIRETDQAAAEEARP